MRRRGIRIIEVATVCAVLGILVSLAIPALMQMQARSRVDHLLASARSCREDLPRWLSDTLSSRPVAANSGTGSRDLLEDFARIYNERFQEKNLPGEKPLLVVEPLGTPPVYCSRDGRIHLIPCEDPAEEGIGATLVVTHEDRKGGPAYNGILAVYSVEPGTE
jgi:hypothetical protein